MSKEIISVQSLFKDYGKGRGIYDINFHIKQGETFGFVGTNGSGKTTTIRHIMGFLKPDAGVVLVKGLNAWSDSQEIKKYMEYVPGEIAFPDLSDARTFLKSHAQMLGLNDMAYAEELVGRLQLDTGAPLKRMSKGMKQKTAIIASLMADKEIIILDEPTTGLDPLMRKVFLDIIKKEQAKGKTILMSSQSFAELEEICDRVALIFNGKIVDIADIKGLKNQDSSILKIEFEQEAEYLKFKTLGYEIVRDQEKFWQATIKIKNEKLNELFGVLQNFKLRFIVCEEFNLEKHFKSILLKGGTNV